MSHPEISNAFRLQIRVSRDAGSEFTARILEHCLEDLEAGGALARLVGGFEGHPFQDALCQRVLGAVQALVLEGRLPELARFYPSVGGTPVWPDAGRAFVEAVGTHREALAPRLREQVQTNEAGRCAGLLGGFLDIAAGTGLPLRLLEIGSSAGLNLYWDRYRYSLRGADCTHYWGDPDSRVSISAAWEGRLPPLAVAAPVASRLGCDLHPLDATQPEQLRRIESFYWADQPDRHDLLRAAAAALKAPAPVEAISAGAFVAREVAELPDGLCSVLFHSTMWSYLPPDEQRAVTEAMTAASQRATLQAPLAWLRSEPASPDCVEIRLQTWPGGQDRLLGRAHHHGRWVHWQA